MIFINKKKKDQNSLIKVYKVVTQEEAEKFSPEPLINFFLTIASRLNVKLDDFYVTGHYPNKGWKTSNGFINGLQKKNYKNIHHLMISDSQNLFFINFQNWVHNFTVPINFGSISLEIMIDEKLLTKYQNIDIASNLYQYFKFEYGYKFNQFKNISISEGLIKNKWLSYSVKNNSYYQKWVNYQTSIMKGYIRKIYQANYLSKIHLQQTELKELILSKKIGKLKKFGDGYFWKLSVDEQSKASSFLKHSNLIVENKEFDTTKIKKVIDLEHSKYRFIRL